jgi:phosphopantothenoylcysteine decarboxylase/phosphopantothenate--cysteine ligase
MRVLVTAGPTREYIDSVRFITNASSGRMGYACAAAALAAGHEVTLIAGATTARLPQGIHRLIHITSADDLKAALAKEFDRCDALIMAAAVGDFTVKRPWRRKLPRAGGPVTITLIPTEDILAGLGRRRRAGQVLVGFAVEDRRKLEKARREMLEKNCDYLVLNTPAAMGASSSWACILTRQGLALPWGERSKAALARKIVALLERPG